MFEWNQWLCMILCVSVCMCECRRMACSPSPPMQWRISCLCCARGASVLRKMRPKTHKCCGLLCAAWRPWSICCTAAALPKGRWRLRPCSTTISSCSTGADHQWTSREMASSGRKASSPCRHTCSVRDASHVRAYPFILHYNYTVSFILNLSVIQDLCVGVREPFAWSNFSLCSGLSHPADSLQNCLD